MGKKHAIKKEHPKIVQRQLANFNSSRTFPIRKLINALKSSNPATLTIVDSS